MNEDHCNKVRNLETAQLSTLYFEEILLYFYSHTQAERPLRIIGSLLALTPSKIYLSSHNSAPTTIKRHSNLKSPLLQCHTPTKRVITAVLMAMCWERVRLAGAPHDLCKHFQIPIWQVSLPHRIYHHDDKENLTMCLRPGCITCDGTGTSNKSCPYHCTSASSYSNNLHTVPAHRNREVRRSSGRSKNSHSGRTVR